MTDSDINPPTVLLSGPTSGLGAKMFEALLVHPARPRLVLLARDSAALDGCVARVLSLGVESRGIRIDLSDLASVREALAELRDAIDAGDIAPIDVALLNAGAQFSSRRKTGAQGSELTFTVNVIAQHLLLRGLEPMLAPRGHVVLMGSSTHRGKRASFNLVPDPQWTSPEDMASPQQAIVGSTRFAEEREQGGIAYATSKLALVTLAHDWASRLAVRGRRLNTYDPGLVPGTGLGKDLPGYMYWVWKHLMPAMSLLPGASTPRRSAKQAVRLALGDEYAEVHDGYVEIDRLTSAAPATFDERRRRELWQWLESAIADWIPAGAEAEQ